VFLKKSDNNIDIDFLTATGLTPGSSNTVHIYTLTVHRTTQLTTLVGTFLGFEPRVVKLIGMIAGRAPPVRLIPWNLPYN
jgi:uncharacterized integral membrane protein